MESVVDIPRGLRGYITRAELRLGSTINTLPESGLAELAPLPKHRSSHIMAAVQSKYRNRAKATPQKKTIWIVVYDPPHSDYAEEFSDLDDLAEELRRFVQERVSEHRNKSNIEWSSGEPYGRVQAGAGVGVRIVTQEWPEVTPS